MWKYLAVTPLLVWASYWHARRQYNAARKASIKIRIPTDLTMPTREQMKNLLDAPTQRRYAIVGFGMLGRSIADLLLLREEDNVFALDCAPQPADLLEGITYIRLDIADRESVLKVFAEHHFDVVFMNAAVLTYMHHLPYQWPETERVNVGGLKNVLDAALETQVAQLIYTSTAKVWMGRSRVGKFHLDVTEDTHQAVVEDASSHYLRSKAMAEEMVLGAASKLSTVILRPCSGVFGERDNQILIGQLQKVMQGQLTHMALFRNHIMDWVYVENVSYAHVLASDRLAQPRNIIAGSTYYISNNGMLEKSAALGYYDLIVKMQRYLYDRYSYRLPVRVVPMWVVSLLAYGLDAMRWLTNGAIDRLLLPTMKHVSVPLLHILRTDYRHCTKKAAKELGYKPVFTLDQGLKKCLDYSAKHFLPK